MSSIPLTLSDRLTCAWTALAQVFLGAWLLSNPATLPLTGVLAWSDYAVGAIALLFGILNVRRRAPWRDWILCLLGIWLMLAPLIAFTPSSAAYGLDTFIGLFLVFFSVVLPVRGHDGGPEIPEGWSYNPASYQNRAPIVVIGFFGFFLARYLAAFQLGHIDSAWDPFFGDGTEKILLSEVSKAFPVPDAGLGAMAYLLECVSGIVGDNRRWRTMPWLSLLFVLLVVPTGTVSVVLVILQPLSVGAWCTICLITALTTLATVPPAIDEVIAMGQYVLRRRREGHSMWRVFWLGDRGIEAAKAGEERQVKEPWIDLPVSWHLAVVALIGLWLMAAPGLLGNTGLSADNDRLLGALIVTFAVIGMAEVSRPVRFLNVLFGAWLAVSAWFLDGRTVPSAVGSTVAGLTAIIFSLPKGKIEERHGGWDRWIV